MEAQEKRAVGVALDFPERDGYDPSSCSWPPRRRLQEEYNRSPSTAEDIVARFRDADLGGSCLLMLSRKMLLFYIELSSKARPKQRSPAISSSQDEDLSHHLEVKLMAAEQKRTWRVRRTAFERSGPDGGIDLDESGSGSRIQPRPNTGSIWFKIQDLEKATDKFSQKNFIGRGGFGIVYKGVLRDGMTVAVKRIVESDFEGDDKFCHEVEIISNLKHRNLVPLRGCCVVNPQR